MDNLFAYGTLMCQDIMEKVAGCRPAVLHGTLKNFCRRSIKGETYPGIIPQANSLVKGMIYRNVPYLAWKRLDRFEGEMYMRQSVKIELENGTLLSASTYVIKPGFRYSLERSEWNFEEFLHKGKTHFQRYYSGYHELK